MNILGPRVSKTLIGDAVAQSGIAALAVSGVAVYFLLDYWLKSKYENRGALQEVRALTLYVGSIVRQTQSQSMNTFWMGNSAYMFSPGAVANAVANG